MSYVNNKRRNALTNAGVNPDRYLSLHIDRNIVPEGSEIVVQVRDLNTGELHPVDLTDVWDGCFAKTSKFYGMTMSDGNIFNPYIHRRFLPSQFRRNIRTAGYDGIQEYVRTHYDWNYVVRFLGEECAKLAMLQRRDRDAFMERSRFFTLADMKQILGEYAGEVIRVLDEAVEKEKKNGTNRSKTVIYYIPGTGEVQQAHMRPMRYRFEQFGRQVMDCRSYAQLAGVIEKFDFAHLNNRIPSSVHFAKCFIESGAYYTIKQMLMFEGLTLGKGNVTDDLEYLRGQKVGEFIWLYRRLNL